MGLRGSRAVPAALTDVFLRRSLTTTCWMRWTRPSRPWKSRRRRAYQMFTVSARARGLRSWLFCFGITIQRCKEAGRTSGVMRVTANETRASANVLVLCSLSTVWAIEV